MIAPRRALLPRFAAPLLALSLLAAACGDDDSPSVTGTTIPQTTTTAAATTTTASGEATDEQAREVVRTFAEQQVGMVDPVVGDLTPVPGDADAGTIEVRTRREGGGEDPTLTPTVVTVRNLDGTWSIESATSEHITIESPPPGQLLSAGFVTPSGMANAFEGTVIVQALLGEGPEVLGEQVTTAESGNALSFWAARVETGTGNPGPGYILAFTTAGTDLGPPVFALVPVEFA